MPIVNALKSKFKIFCNSKLDHKAKMKCFGAVIVKAA